MMMLKLYSLQGFPWLPLSIRLYRPSFSAGPQDQIVCLYRAIVVRFLPEVQHLLVCVKESSGERCLLVRPKISSRVLHVLFV